MTCIVHHLLRHSCTCDDGVAPYNYPYGYLITRELCVCNYMKFKIELIHQVIYEYVSIIMVILDNILLISLWRYKEVTYIVAISVISVTSVISTRASLLLLLSLFNASVWIGC